MHVTSTTPPLYNQTAKETFLHASAVPLTAVVGLIAIVQIGYCRMQIKKNLSLARSPTVAKGPSVIASSQVALKTDDLFRLFQSLTKKLDTNCALLEQRYGAQLNSPNVTGRAVNALADFCLPKLSLENSLREDSTIMASIMQDYASMNTIQKEFRKTFVFTESYLAGYDCRIRKLSKIFQTEIVEQNKSEEKDQAVLRRLVDQQTASFAEIMGSYVYTHLPLEGNPSQYYSPWGSRAAILKGLGRCGFLGYSESKEPTYQGYSINFHYTVFGKRCTAISLRKVNVQRQGAEERFGIEEKGLVPWIKAGLMKKFEDKSKTEETLRNQQNTINMFLTLEALETIYEQNYAACHIPTEEELIHDYKLPLNQVARSDFIMLFHRPFDENLNEAFNAAPFDRYIKSKNFLMRIDNNDLEDVEKKQDEAFDAYSTVRNTVEEVEPRRLMRAYYLLARSLEKEKEMREQGAFGDLKSVEPPSLCIEEVGED